MASLLANVAAAVVTELNDQSFSLEFTATRKWLTKWQLEDLATLQVAVMPGPATWEMLHRGADEKRITTDIVVGKKITPEELAEPDALAGLLEELVAHFRAKSLTAGSTGMICMRRTLIPGESAAIASPEVLADARCFFGALRLEWLMRQ